MNIYHFLFLFFFVYLLSHSVSTLGTFMQYVSYNKLRHPPGLEGKGWEAEEQKQWGQCSRHRAATAHGVLGTSALGG